MISLLGIAVAMGLGLLGRDAWGWLPALSRAAIWTWTLLLPAERRAVRRAEWPAELAEAYDERRVSGLVWAFSLLGMCAWERATATDFRFGAFVPRAGSCAAGVAFGAWLVFAGHELILVSLAVAALLPAFGIFAVVVVALARTSRQEDREFKWLSESSTADFLAFVEALGARFDRGSRRGQRLARIYETVSLAAVAGSTRPDRESVKEAWYILS